MFREWPGALSHFDFHFNPVGMMMTAAIHSTHPQTDALVTIGRILKPFGVKGEVKVESLSDVPRRFEGLQKVYLTPSQGDSIPKETTVTHVRTVPAGYLIRFSAFSTPEEASPFRGAWIQIPPSSNLPRTPDTFYQFELIGLRVEDPEGRQMGKVEEVLDYPQHHVLVVRDGAKEFLIPAIRRTIKKVDLTNQCVHVASKEWWDLSHAV